MEVIPIGTIYFDQYVLKSQDELTSGTYFELGDVLLAKITPSFENGKQGIIEDLPTPFGIATTEVIPIRGIPGVSDKLFLFYYLLRHNIRAELAGKMEGTTGRQRLNKSTLENLEIPLPPLAEQRAIAHTLRTVQAARAARQREAALERERKAALMQRLFTQGTRGEPTKTTEIGEVPVSWEITKLGTAVNGREGLKRGPWGGSIKKEMFVKSGYKVYEQKNVILRDFSTGTYYIDESKFQELREFEVQPGDVLITAAGTIGKIAIVPHNAFPGIINQALLRVRIDAKTLDKDYFVYLMNYFVTGGELEKVSHGATLQNLSSLSVLRNIMLPRPIISEQRTIAEILRACDTKIAALEREAAAHDELFKALLEELMTGRVQVPGANNH